MATFDNQSGEFDKVDDLAFFPWRAANANPNDSQDRQNIVNAWLHELNGFDLINCGAEVCDITTANLANLTGDLIVMGHGNTGDRIVKDQGYALSARTLAKLLEEKGLPQNFGNKIVLWSCYGGAPGGAAQSLSVAMKNRGYMALEVWGCKVVTGKIMNKMFVCFPNYVSDANFGQPALATLAYMARY